VEASIAKASSAPSEMKIVPLYSSAWPSAENFAEVALEPILVIQSPLSSLTFSVLISLRVEKRSLVVPPPLETQLAPAGSYSSSEVNSGAAAIPSPSAVSGSVSVSVSAGSFVSSVASVVEDEELLLPPPQPAITSAAISPTSRQRRMDPRNRLLPMENPPAPFPQGAVYIHPSPTRCWTTATIFNEADWFKGFCRMPQIFFAIPVDRQVVLLFVGREQLRRLGPV
jgi:hypothetical protein